MQLHICLKRLLLKASLSLLHTIVQNARYRMVQNKEALISRDMIWLYIVVGETLQVTWLFVGHVSGGQPGSSATL